MKNQSAEDYLDKLLNSVNGESEEEDITAEESISTEGNLFEVEDTQDEYVSPFSIEDEVVEPVAEKNVRKSSEAMHSRRVSKSEADFLMEFEEELAGEDFDDFLKNFDKEAASIDAVDISFDGEEFVFGDTKKTPAPAVTPEPVEEFPLDALFAEAPVTEQESIMEQFPELDNEVTENPLDLFGIDELPEISSQEPTEEAVPMFENSSGTEDSFDLGGVDLGALLNEAAADSTESAESTPIDDDDLMSMLTGGSASASDGSVPASDEPPVDDMFSNLFGDDAVGEAGDISNLFSDSGDSSEGIDLGNLGEADLMSLLSGEGGLSDLGDMLSENDSSEMPMDGLDAFAAFAENEMASQAEAPAEDTGKKAKKASKGKGGLLDKIKALLSDDDDDEVELKKSSAPSADQLSGENADILAEMDAEDKAGKAKGGLFAKLKKDKGADDKKEKKEKKEKKPKKEKPKKEKKPKVPKEKKPKKPKEIDTTPPLPKGPVIMIWLMVLSLFGLVFLGTNLVGYASCVSEAKSYYNTGNYAEAYQELLGLKLKEKDMALYNQVATLATVDSELNAYKVFLENERYTEAFDSLICAAGRCELNEDSAEVYECLGQMEILKKEVMNELNNYDMTYEQALDMYHIKDREDYTIALYTKLKELGLE